MMNRINQVAGIVNKMVEVQNRNVNNSIDFISTEKNDDEVDALLHELISAAKEALVRKE